MSRRHRVKRKNFKDTWQSEVDRYFRQGFMEFLIRSLRETVIPAKLRS